jgi:hypothetical protein
MVRCIPFLTFAIYKLLGTLHVDSCVGTEWDRHSCQRAHGTPSGRFFKSPKHGSNPEAHIGTIYSGLVNLNPSLGIDLVFTRTKRKFALISLRFDISKVICFISNPTSKAPQPSNRRTRPHTASSNPSCQCQRPPCAGCCTQSSCGRRGSAPTSR